MFRASPFVLGDRWTGAEKEGRGEPLRLEEQVIPYIASLPVVPAEAGTTGNEAQHACGPSFAGTTDATGALPFGASGERAAGNGR